jgi:transcriptional regulator with XRE-family HTH domain
MEKSTHTPEYAAIREQLRSARENAGLTQRELATRLHVPHSWVAKIESGERRVDLVEFGWFVLACGADPIPLSKRLLQEIVAKRKERQLKGGSKG